MQCIYASTSGNVEFVVETVAQHWDEAGTKTLLHRAEIADHQILNQESLFLFATSTWEHGVLNPFFDEFLLHMKQTDCSGKKAFFIGCGDRRYEAVLFCKGMKIVKQTFKEQGGEILGRPLLINGSPYGQKDTHIIPWAEKMQEVLKSV